MLPEVWPIPVHQRLGCIFIRFHKRATDYIGSFNQCWLVESSRTHFLLVQSTSFCFMLNSSTPPFWYSDWKPKKWLPISSHWYPNKWLKFREVLVLAPGSRDESGIRKVDPAVSSETTEAQWRRVGHNGSWRSVSSGESQHFRVRIFCFLFGMIRSLRRFER